MASSSAPSAINPKEKYDVFLSFRGTDTRKSFTSHLLKALNEKGIDTCIDYRLERGDEIDTALLQAIEGSKISVIIFSEDYASSIWCLKELVHILECKETNGQHVIPIFYQIDPSDVRHQTGTYELEERFKHRAEAERLKWKNALKKAAKLSGFDSTSSIFRDDSGLIDQVIKDISKKISLESPIDLTGFVGVERRIKKIESLLCPIPQDDCVRTVGIWGMAGIGKSTLADLVFRRVSSGFKACCFLANVREASGSREGLYNLRNKLLRTLLGDESLDIDTPSLDFCTKVKLHRAKVLVVLDDVNDSSQLEFLVGCGIPFGPGSRIIVTTRDMQQIRLMKVLREGADHDVEIYKVEELDSNESFELLHLNAPREIYYADNYTEFSKKVVDYAAGIPLFFTILRPLFHKRLWNEIKEALDEKLQTVYRVSYDALLKNEKEIFLDIACFYKGEDIDGAKRKLDACGLSADSGIKVLIDMSLISVEGNRLWMHDVIQEMGWDIVREKCPEEAGNRTRLYTQGDICHVLEKDTGTATVQSICFPRQGSFSPIEINMTTEAFEKMYNLRYLNFSHLHSNLLIPQCPKSLPDALRYLCWPFYPWKYLPSNFSPRFLVELDMPYSNLRTLWNKGQIPWKLKRINLSFSFKLVQVPNLLESPNTVSVNLHGCPKLVQVPSYYQNLHKLTSLNLGMCLNLRIVPEIPSMEFLDLSGTAIEELPSSIERLTRIVSIKLRDCKNFLSLSTSICKLKSLKELDLSYCSRFLNFPEILEPMEHLEFLYLSGTKIKEIHKSIENLVVLKKLYLKDCTYLKFVSNSIYKLNLLEDLSFSLCYSLRSLPPSLVIVRTLLFKLDLTNCTALEEIPDGLMICLTSLKELYLSGSMIQIIPPSIKQASELRVLFIRKCKCLQSLPELPCLLEVLRADGCINLKKASRSMTTLTQGLDQLCDPGLEDRQEQLTFSDCLNLDKNARSSIMDDAQLRIMRMATAWSKRKEEMNPEEFDRNVLSPSFSVNVICPGNEIPKWFSYQTEGSSISIKHLTQTNFLHIALSTVVTNREGKYATGRGNTIRSLWRKTGFECKINVKRNNGRSFDSNVTLFKNNTCEMFDSSKQVLVCYDADWSAIFGDANEVSFHFVPNVWFQMKRCGVYLFYAQCHEARDSHEALDGVRFLGIDQDDKNKMSDYTTLLNPGEIASFSGYDSQDDYESIGSEAVAPLG